MAQSKAYGHRPSSRDEIDESAEVVAPAGQGSTADTDVDAMLTEIDAVLEENAEEFVRSFVQKGGQ